MVELFFPMDCASAKGSKSVFFFVLLSQTVGVTFLSD